MIMIAQAVARREDANSFEIRVQLTDFAWTVHIFDRKHRTQTVKQNFGKRDYQIGIGD